MGDVWSNGQHVGIFLGIGLYISARDRPYYDTLGTQSGVEYKSGINIKEVDPGGTYRRYAPTSTTDPTGKCSYSKNP